jgi:arylsulfatase A-like enzyme
MKNTLLCFFTGVVSLLLTGQLHAKNDPPNIVFILTDNQGAWHLGCYGNPDFQTPNIDRMAEEGVRFTRAFSNNAVCSPTRATFLTGLTPSQHGIHRYLSAGKSQMGPEAYYTLEEFTTLPEMLSQAGYVCGLSGKWHLGDNLHPQDGFTFWTTKAHGHSLGFLNQEVIDDGKLRNEKKHLSEYWTDRGIEFIEKSRLEQPDKPFFLFLAYNGPYSLSTAMKEPVPSPWSDPYVDHPLPSFPRPSKIHPWQRNQHELIGDVQIGRNLAGQVTAIDAGVGRIMETLKKLDLDGNTLVIYTADQGAVAGHAGFWGMGDHTNPIHGRDGTMHIPMIFRWPGKIPANRVEDHLVTNYDFMPSLLSFLGRSMPQHSPTPSPGRDFSPALHGEKLSNWHDVVFYDFENVRHIRTGDWKYVERLGQAPEFELFDLKADPDELTNLAGQKVHTVIQARLRDRLHAWFKRHADPKWDLWTGGKSKSGIGTQEYINAALRK